MTALLRFQAVVLWRRLTTPEIAVSIALVAAATYVSGGMWPGRDWTTWLMWPAFVMTIFGFPFAGFCMARTLSALEVAGRPAPISRRRILAAHLLFGTAVSVVLAAATTELAAPAIRDAPFLFVDLVLFGVLLTSATPVLQRRSGRRRRRDVALVVGLAAITLLPTIAGVAMAWGSQGRFGAALLGGAACLWLTASAWTFLRDQYLPAEAGGRAPIVGKKRRKERGPRTPGVALLRSAYGRLPAVLWIAWATANVCLLPRAPLSLLWPALAGLNLARYGTSTWHWLAASPIDRGRAFRLLFGPVVAFVLLATAARFVALGLAPAPASTARGEDLVDVLAAALGFLLMFRLQMSGRWRALVGGLVFAGLFVGTFGLSRFLPLREWIYAPVRNASWPETVLVSLAAAGVGFLLWRGSARAFRRLQATDLAPTDTWSPTTVS